MTGAVVLMCLLVELQIYDVHAFVTQYTKMNPRCQMENSIFETFSGGTLVQCGSLCDSNSYGKCSRFIWDQYYKTCMLHSNTTYPGTSTYSVTTWSGLTTYSETRKECKEVGYDYDSETNTCLKVLKSSSGVTWKEARVICQQDGADLISISTKVKWDFVTNYLRCTYAVWIGLKAHVWLTGESFVNVFGVDMQLNGHDAQFPLDSESNCGVLALKWAVPLQDERCNIRTKYIFVCEVVLP